MALQTKTFEGTSVNYWRFSIEVIEDSTSVSANTSSVTVNAWLGRTGSSSQMTGPELNGTVTIAGVGSKTFKYTSNSGTVSTGQLKLKIGTVYFTVPHGADGTKTISISASFTNDISPQSGSLSAQSMALTAIPRYATVTQSVSSKTETSITMKWTSDSTIDYIWYSTNNGSTWTGYNTADGTSGTYTIGSLSANTTYNVKTRVRRKDSQLTTDSSATSVATYNYPYANSMPDFVVGNSMTVGVYNPLGRSFTLTLVASNNQEITTESSYTGTSVTGFSAQVYQNLLYGSIPSAKSGTYKVRINYGAHTETRTGGKYSINESTNAPTIGTVSVTDENATIVAITGDSSVILQNQSDVRVKATSLTAKNSASISSATYTYSGQSTGQAMTISSGTATASATKKFPQTSTTVTVKVTDSRGLTASKSLSVSVVAYSAPTAVISLRRENSYYNTSYLTVTGTIAPITVGGVQKNSIQSLVYSDKQASSSTYPADTSITSGVQYTLDLDNQSAWDFRIQITDKIQTITLYAQLPKGIPLIMFDRKRNSVGINAIPSHNDAFEVGDNLYVNNHTSADSYGNRIYAQDIFVEPGRKVDDNGAAIWFRNGAGQNVGTVYNFPSSQIMYVRSYRPPPNNNNYEQFAFPTPSATGPNTTYNVLTDKDFYTTGTWIPQIYDLNTYKRSLPSSRYWKVGKLFFSRISISDLSQYSFTTSTMLQIRNWPCAEIIGGSIYISTMSGNGGDRTVQASSTGAYFRPNITGTFSSGIMTIFLVGVYS